MALSGSAALVITSNADCLFWLLSPLTVQLLTELGPSTLHTMIMWHTHWTADTAHDDHDDRIAKIQH